MKKQKPIRVVNRYFAILLMLILIVQILPTAAYASSVYDSYSTILPSQKCQTGAEGIGKRLDKILTDLRSTGRECFTTTGSNCNTSGVGGHGCDKCKLSNIVASLNENTAQWKAATGDGTSCNAFARYVFVKLFDTTHGTTDRKSLGRFNDASIYNTIKSGDFLHLRNGSSNHFVIFLSYDGNGIWVLDGNGDRALHYGVNYIRNGYYSDVYQCWSSQFWDSVNNANKHTCKYSDNGFCISPNCTVPNKDYLNTSQGATQTLKGQISTLSGQYVPIKQRPYSASARLVEPGKLKNIKVVGRVINHFSKEWFKVQYLYDDAITKTCILKYGYVYNDPNKIKLTKDPNTLVTSVSMMFNRIDTGTSLYISSGHYGCSISSSDGYTNLSSVTFGIYNSDGTPARKNSGVNEVTLNNIGKPTFSITPDQDKLMFSQLAAGDYYITISGVDIYGVKSKNEQKVSFSVAAKNIPVYTVSFNPNGGSGSTIKSNITSGNSKALSTIAVPTKAGYDFLGWSSEINDSSAQYTSSDNITPGSNIELFAIWKPIEPPKAPVITMKETTIAQGDALEVSWTKVETAETYTVKSYDINANEIDSQKLKTSLTCVKFDSSGVYKIAVSASNYTGESPYSTPLTVNVKAPVTVTFKDYDNSTYSEQKVKYGTSAVLPVNPTREGYTFSSWSGNYQNAKADTIVTARYTPIEYTVTFLDSLGKIAKVQKVTYNDDTPGNATPPSESALNIASGYTLVGWDTNDYLSVKKNITVKPSIVWANQDVPIVTTINDVTQAGNGYWVKYTITNNGDSNETGRVIVVLKSNFGKFLTKTESGAFYLSKKEGQTPSDYTGQIYVPLSSVPEGEIFTTVEVYVVNSFDEIIPISQSASINVIAGEGDWSRWMNATELEELGSSYTEIETKTQYSSRNKQTTTVSTSTYLDWTPDGTSSALSGWGNWGSWKDAAITANNYTDVQTRQAISTPAYSQYRYGKYTNASNWGHFHNAYYNTNCWPIYTNWSTSRVTPESTSAFLGFWATQNNLGTGSYENNRYEWRRYMVTNGTNQTGSSNAFYWEQIQTVPATYKTQYRSRTRSDVTQYNFYKWSEWSDWSDSVLTASTNTEVRTQTLTRVKLAMPPTQGMYTVSTSIPNATSIANKQAIITAYKIDEASDYSIEYVGQTVLDDSGSYSFSFRTLEEPTAKTGDFTVTLTIEGAASPMYIGTIKAPKPTYSVKFVDEISGHQLGETQSVEEGRRATAPSVPEKEGYNFIGWEYGLGNIREDMIIKARFIPKTYTVLFVDWANYTVSMKSDIPYASKLEFPEITAPEGYSFLGWSAPNGFNLDRITSNMVVTADYEELSYKVRFLDYEGNTVDEQTVTHASSAVAPETDISVPEDMYFIGWNKDDYSLIDHPVSISPQVAYLDDAAVPQASLKSGIYEGTQSVELSCSDENATIYYTIVSPDSAPVGTQIYDGPLTINATKTINVYAEVPNKNNSSELSYEYVIVPQNSTPASPENIELTADEDSVQISWEAVSESTGYVINKTDAYGSESKFTTTATTYNDTAVEGINYYTYSVASYKLVGEGGKESYINSIQSSEKETIEFLGSYKAVSNIQVIAPVSIPVGGSAEASAIVSPSDAYNKEITWSVENGTGKATISENGVISAILPGVVTIKAKAKDTSAASASVPITITETTDQIPLKVTSASIWQGSQATISINIDENSKATMMQFVVLYDSSKVTLKECTPGAAIAALQPTINSSTPGIVYFNWDSLTGITAGGSLIDLTFSAADEELDEQDILIEIPTDDSDYEFIFMENVNEQSESLNIAVINGKLSYIIPSVGDVNADGSINIIDANLVRRYTAQLITFNEYQLASSDVNGDGSSDIIDANFIRRYAANLIDTFPAQ